VAQDLYVERVHEVDIWEEAEVTRLGMCLGGHRLLGLLRVCECGLVHARLSERDTDTFQVRSGQA